MGWIRTAAVFGLLAVALGAFGAHALRDRLPERMMAAYNTGILYQLVHSVSLLALALYARASATHITLPASLFAAGMVLFSGSLYVMAASGWAKLGMVTPFGGIALLGGWGSLLWAIR